MKKFFLLSAIAILFCFHIKALNVTIIESISGGHTMDSKWDTLLNNLGHTASIFPQTTLDNNAFFATTDVLIVSSGIIFLPPNRVNTIKQFLLQGGDVYLQTEYLATFSPDSAFELIVNSLGGGFYWTGTVSGTLSPTIISGTIATTPNAVSPLSYFWYGCTANPCSNVETFLTYQGNGLGFAFCSPSPSVGRLITTSDQDWIQSAMPNDLLLMENIFYRLIDPAFACTGTVYPYLTLGNDTSICAGDSLVLNAGTGFLNYTWNTANSDSSLTIFTPGTYWVTVTTPCNTYMDSINVSLCSGISEALNTNPGFVIFPNPSNGHFTIHFNNLSPLRSKASVNLYDATGRTILQEEIFINAAGSKKEMKLNISSGIYFLELNEGNRSTRRKLVVNKN